MNARSGHAGGWRMGLAALLVILVSLAAGAQEGSEVSPPTMSLDVQNAEIQTVLRGIAEYAGVSIVADNNVTGTVTVRATDLHWREMLATVCRSAQLVAIPQGPVIRVATSKTASDEALARESAARKAEEYMPLTTRIVPIQYASAEELIEVLDTMTSARGRVEADPRTNSLLFTDIEPQLDQLEATARRLDDETAQVEIVAKIVDVDAVAARQLGISWTGTQLHSYGADADGQISLNPADIVDPSMDVRVGVIRSFGQIQAKLQALETENKADIISTPRITTVNNRLARILVGKEVPLITLDEAGNAITELKKVGITLEVTPYINSDDMITMDLHPEISDLSQQSTVQGGIVFNKTEADTRAMVRAGETAVIGGLIRTSEIRYERGVPLLRDIPFLGRLFGSTDTRTEKRELLIFVTPNISQPNMASASP
ncbi:MAG: hypothetical protein GF330_14345 [Candidatus Eisenbacteria bacterium]|nr:hypothetical protein [Candidatus Eisenbacteria bacterium]